MLDSGEDVSNDDVNDVDVVFDANADAEGDSKCDDNDVIKRAIIINEPLSLIIIYKEFLQQKKKLK